MATQAERLQDACLGERPKSYEEVMRAHAAEVYRELYGEPVGSLLHVPPYCDYEAGEQLVAKAKDGSERKCTVLRTAPEIGLIEVIYGDP